jgi:peptide/nickel transport system substrate-binding protein
MLGRSTMFKLVGACVLSLGTLTTLSNGSGASSMRQHSTPSGSPIIVGLGAMQPTLNPYVADTPPATFFSQALYSTLTTIAEVKGVATTLPSVATSWKETNATTWQFTLKSGLTFPDNEPLNATAVAFSYNYFVNPTAANSLAPGFDIKSATAVSTDTVDITTTVKNVLLPRLASYVALIPPTAFTSAGATAFFNNPVATGPWKVQSWNPGQELVLVPNSGSIGPEPNSSQLTFQLIASDASRVAALQSGEVDIINTVPTDQTGILTSGGDKVVNQISPRIYIADLYEKTGPLSNVLVRQAINYAVDKKGLADDLFGGMAQVANGQLASSQMSGYCPGVTAYPYNVKKAKALIKKAGYAGKKITLTFQTSSGFLPDDTDLAEAIAAQLGQVGITVNVNVMPFADYLDVFFGTAARPGLFSWGNDGAATLDAQYTDAFYVPTATQHPTGFSNAAVNALFAKVTTEALGSSARQKTMCSLAGTLKSAAPVLFGIFLPDTWATTSSVTGFSDPVSGSPNFAVAQLKS